MEIGSTTSQATTTPVKETALAKLSSDMDMFLSLLTTQLQNQDPLNPMDTKDMTAQLVQFAGVEQQIKQGQNLEKLVNLQTASAEASVVSYIGHSATVKGSTVPLGPNGISFGYDLPKSVTTAKLQVVNADTNKVVREVDGEISRGRHVFDWDGMDEIGAQVAAGNYKLRVNAVDTNNEGVTAEIDVTGKVTGVQSGTQGPQIMMGDRAYYVADVSRVTLI